jgi:hypothetical protein
MVSYRLAETGKGERTKTQSVKVGNQLCTAKLQYVLLSKNDNLMIIF